MDEWKEIPDYNCRYYINKKGQIKNNDGLILKQNKNYKGYISVHLRKDRKSSNFFVHRLVAKTFIGDSKLQVNHIDGNKSNNNIENLEYVDNRENKLHSLSSKKIHGVAKIGKRFSARTEINNKCIHIGMYNTEEEAYKAYIDFCSKLGSKKYI